MKKYALALAFMAIVLVGGGAAQTAHAGTTDLSGWAWSSNIGWISFNSADTGAGGGPYKVTISTSTADSSDGTFSGWAWSPNIGWVSFNNSDLAGCVKGDGSSVDTNTDRMKANLASGAVTGWIRAYSGKGRTDGWDGCIELSGTNHATNNTAGTGGVTYTVQSVNGSQSGIFKGYAWGGAVVGWINFAPSIGGSGDIVVCVTACTPGGGTSLSLTATQGLNTSVHSLSAPVGSPITLNWTINGLTNCVYSGSDWSKVSNKGTIILNTSGSGVLTYATGDEGSGHVLTITCDVPNTSPVEHKTDQVTITVTAQVNQTFNCPTPNNAIQCFAPAYYTAVPQGTPTIINPDAGSCGSTPTYCSFYCDTANGYTLENGVCSNSSESEF